MVTTTMTPGQKLHGIWAGGSESPVSISTGVMEHSHPPYDHRLADTPLVEKYEVRGIKPQIEKPLLCGKMARLTSWSKREQTTRFKSGIVSHTGTFCPKLRYHCYHRVTNIMFHQARLHGRRLLHITSIDLLATSSALKSSCAIRARAAAEDRGKKTCGEQEDKYDFDQNSAKKINQTKKRVGQRGPRGSTTVSHFR